MTRRSNPLKGKQLARAGHDAELDQQVLIIQTDLSDESGTTSESRMEGIRGDGLSNNASWPVAEYTSSRSGPKQLRRARVSDVGD
jgi:hypothetical protein